MKPLVHGAVRQPITVAVGVVLVVLAGLVAFTSVPIQLGAPGRLDRGLGAYDAPVEIESDILEEQEDVLADIDSLVSMISTARTGSARSATRTGTDIDEAVAAVDQKLIQVPFYPDGVNPVIETRIRNRSITSPGRRGSVLRRRHPR